MTVPIDYEILRVIWWALLGILLIGFAIFYGVDLGPAILLPFLGRTDRERRLLINSVGPVWECNQVWFILGGGAAFAAWPPLYAASFSGFYLAMLVVLLALILRPVAFKFRGKLDNAAWRTIWDWALFIGGFVPTLIFGVAFGNMLQGVPFHFDDDLRPFYTGDFFGLLNPFALLCGLVSVAMLTAHGAVYVWMKTAEALGERARRAGIAATRHLRAVRGRRRLALPRHPRLRDHRRDRSRRPIEPAAQDRAGRGRRLVRQLPRPPLDGNRPDPRPRRPAAHRVAAHAAKTARRVPGGRGRPARHHRDTRARHVPVHPAVVGRAEGEPDRVGRLVEPADAVHHADRVVIFLPIVLAYTAWSIA